MTEFHGANPHSQIFVDAKDNDGKVVNWAIEALAPAVLKRAGWTRETLHAGDQITINLAPSKKGTAVGMIRKVVLPDGKELTGDTWASYHNIRSSSAGWSAPAPKLEESRFQT